MGKGTTNRLGGFRTRSLRKFPAFGNKHEGPSPPDFEPANRAERRTFAKVSKKVAKKPDAKP
jgi:hypothetical protein